MTGAALLARAAALPGLALLLVASHPLTPSPDLGKAQAACRPNEEGPAIIVEAVGLKDRSGILRLELYPPDDQDFLADDNVLLNAGKPFRRVDLPVPQTGPVTLCMRVPAGGAYSLALLHDRDGNRRFNAFDDGAGFPGNPKLGFSRPKARAATFVAGRGITRLTIRMNYWRGLSFGPLRHVN